MKPGVYNSPLKAGLHVVDVVIETSKKSFPNLDFPSKATQKYDFKLLFDNKLGLNYISSEQDKG